jgi:hypothetical protein
MTLLPVAARLPLTPPPGPRQIEALRRREEVREEQQRRAAALDRATWKRLQVRRQASACVAAPSFQPAAVSCQGWAAAHHCLHAAPLNAPAIEWRRG